MVSVTQSFTVDDAVQVAELEDEVLVVGLVVGSLVGSEE